MISTCLFNHVLIHTSLSYPLSQHDSQWSNSKCSVCTCSHGKVTCGPRDCPPLSCGKDQSPFIPDGDCCPVCAHNGGTVSCNFFFFMGCYVAWESDCFSLPMFLVTVNQFIHIMKKKKMVLLYLRIYFPVELMTSHIFTISFYYLLKKKWIFSCFLLFNFYS